MLTEVVRLPVTEGGAKPLLDYFRDHEYFGRDEILGARFFENEDEPEVMVIIEWRSRPAMEDANAGELTRRFRAGVGPLVSGAPQLSFYADVE